MTSNTTTPQPVDTSVDDAAESVEQAPEGASPAQTSDGAKPSLIPLGENAGGCCGGSSCH